MTRDQQYIAEAGDLLVHYFRVAMQPVVLTADMEAEVRSIADKIAAAALAAVTEAQTIAHEGGADTYDDLDPLNPRNRG